MKLFNSFTQPILFCVICVNFLNAQTFDALNNDLIKHFKIKSVQSNLYLDSTTGVSTGNFRWDYDYYGNLMTKYLMDNESGYEFYFTYYYDSLNRVTKIQEVYFENGNSDTTFKTINYSKNNKLIYEVQKDKKCEIRIDYYYTKDSLDIKIINNSCGSKYIRNIDTVFFQYSNTGRLVHEYSVRQTWHREYAYDTEGLLIKQTETIINFGDTSSLCKLFLYDFGKVIKETEYFSNLLKKEMQPIIYEYTYSKEGKLEKIFKWENGKLQYLDQYVYEYY